MRTNLQMRLGARFGYCTNAEQQRFETLLKAIGLPHELPESVTVDSIIDAMLHDKKVRAGAIRFVFQRGIGDLMVFDGGSYARSVDAEEIRTFLNEQK